MIKITIPDDNFAERKYILDIIFNEFLGLSYDLKIDKLCKFWEIEIENGFKLIFEDHFFKKYPKNLEYLKFENIQQKPSFVNNKFINKDNIPVIYGNDKLEVTNKEIISGIDIFASSFFMLSRWEEYVNKTRDEHNRFSAYDSLAYKNDFLERAIVDEYVDMLKNMLLELGLTSEIITSKNELFLTHDVDEIYKWQNWKHVLKVFLGDILKRKNIFLSLERIAEYYLVKRGKIKDPFYTFDWLMDQSEIKGLKSRFYFMSGGNSKFDNRYSINEQKSLGLIENIKKRDHIIGIHPSYNAYNNLEQLKKEIDLLHKATNKQVEEGREHYLRFEVPTTWQIWEDAGLKLDSTCGYADHIGFRCGTGKEFSVFNIITREKLSLKERPLIVMDGSLFSYQKINYADAYEKIKEMSSASSYTVLWHNSYTEHFKFYKKHLSEI
ncbi:hypothetical protein FJR48_03795 [Sulfurimonas lithotrophica]|uniref:DUF7033 domain-containing protein n=1 Tax=Sulfurimonas lithotrophica TaxID=2590022 RepID=A0A5P8NZL7_9BACT|nr:polysaccharide deacetylase family protein [Sulfurimonas lithotrophica]QFR48889.1 hypothetical protein FJR48_03795 [Sulfurimonas lithotrophica]